MADLIVVRRSFLWGVLYRILVPGKAVATRITKTGFLVSVVIGGLGIAAYSSNSNLLFAVFSILVSSLFLSLLLSLIHFRKISWQLLFPHKLRAQEPGNVVIEVHNERRIFPLYSLVFELRVNQEGKTIFAALSQGVLPRSKGRVVVSLNLPQRGYNRIEIVSVSSIFPFGFVNRCKSGNYVMRALAWTPQIKTSLPWRMPPLLQQHHAEQKTARGDEDFSHLRNYARGDHLKDIHWKASARAQKLLTIERDQPQKIQIRIAVMINHPLTHSLFEKLCITVRELARLAKENYDLQTVVLPHETLWFQSHNSWSKFEDTLALWNMPVIKKSPADISFSVQIKNDEIVLQTEEVSTKKGD